MKLLAKQIFLAASLSFTFSSSQAQQKPRKLIYGVCVHPLTQEAYSKNIDLQLNTIKQINCTYYRVDIPTDSSGKLLSAQLLNILIKKADEKQLKILPIIVFNEYTYRKKPTSESYRNGYTLGQNFSKKYKQYFNYYEIGNEEDNNLILPHRHGNTISEFDTSRTGPIMAYFRGVCNGIKKEDPSAKLIINHAWVHWGFLELLKKHHVKYDIIGLHWYSDMGDLRNANAGFGTVLDTLHKRYKKKIWLTEFNMKDGVPNSLTITKTSWFIKNLKYAYTNPHTDALFLYELFDEPAFANKNSSHSNPNEARYGLTTWHSLYSSIRPKPLFNSYKSFIKTNR